MRYDKEKVYSGIAVEMASERYRLYSRATRKTPEVFLQEGGFVIEGRSIPENPRAFYKPLYEWMLEMFAEAGGSPSVDFAFDYLNTASAKWVFIILRDLMATGKDFKIVWYYERGDDDMLDLGLIYKSLLGCQFVAIEVDEIPVLGQLEI
ncbi:MAG: DUF1987 domain-containing protein [Bacteroidales bacterium]|nr:DUF1987 domain-containing protein [Bacteroidales bacterium]